MPRHIAFLRAINVGGHTVKMDHLRRLFESMDLSAVETFIASGNVIFDSKSGQAGALEKRIEAHLRKELGYEVTTFLRSASDLARVSRYRPFGSMDTDGAALYVAFLKRAPEDTAKRKLLALASDVDEFHFHEREFYWLCRTKMSESSFSGALLEKTIAMPATLRNSTTVRKMAARYGAE